jgi:hypothetical protein
MAEAQPVVLVVGLAPLQNQQVRTLELYPFRFRDRLTGKWIRARHRLQVPELQRRYAEWELTGSPEIRHVQPRNTEPFSPFTRSPPEPTIIAPMLLYAR